MNRIHFFYLWQGKKNAMRWDKQWFQFVILFLLAFTWGSSFILMKTGLQSFTHSQAAAIRIVLASLVLFPLSMKNLKVVRRKDLPYLLISGFVGSFIPAFLFTKAQTQIDSALAGMLNSLTPVFTLVVGVLFFRTPVKIRQVLGLLLGLTGALVLITAGSDITLKGVNRFALFIVVATICYAFNINVVKNYLSHLTGVQITSLSFMFLWPVALSYLLTTDLAAVVTHPGWQVHFLALAALGILGTGVAMLFMNSLIRRTSAVFASSVTYIIPLFAILWGILDGEIITTLHGLGMAVVLTGVYLTNRKSHHLPDKHTDGAN